MSDYLPEAYLRFRSSFAAVAEAHDHVGAEADAAGPLDPRSCRLVRLGVALGAISEGAVRSNARKALDAGVTPDEVRHAAVLAITTRGLPATVAALQWIEDVITARG